MRTALVNCPLCCLAAIAVGFAGIVSAPPAVGQGIQASGGEPSLILGGEFKTIENVQPTEEAKKPWSVYENVGYTSEYNFRGTNLTPDSDGAIFATANITFHGLTLGVYGIHQVGTAKADAFSISEGGGGGTGSNFTFHEAAEAEDTMFVGRVSPQTIQKEFDEIDVYLTYLFQLGPVDITVGNIAFFINRGAETRVTTSGMFTDEGITTRGISQTVTIPTVGDEQFDRLFVEVSAPRLIPAFYGISIAPKIRYYQTILNTGDDPLADGRLLTLANIILPFEPTENHPLTIRGANERNDALGGYLEGLGFNHAQFGATIPIDLWRGSPHFVLTLEPFGAYSYHISDPTAGTDRNEGWGGAQLVLTF